MEPQLEEDADNSSSHGGRRNLKLWQNAAVEVLVEIVKKNHERLSSREEIKGTIWKEIAEKIQDVAPGITAKQAEIKWKNIRLRYFKFKSYKDRDGSKFKCPSYYDILDSFLSHVPPTPRGHSYKYFFETSNIVPLEDSFEDFENFVDSSVTDSSIKDSDFINDQPKTQNLHYLDHEAPHSIFNPNYKSSLLSDLCENIVSKDPTVIDEVLETNIETVPCVQNAADLVECQVEGDSILSHGGKRDIFMWNNRGTGALIHLVKDNYKKLNMKEIKSHKVWKEITQKLQVYVSGVTTKQVRIKWRNIRSYYLKFKFRRTARTKMPPYFRLLSSFLFVRSMSSKAVLYHPGQLFDHCGLEGEPDPNTYANYQERLKLEEHLKKSEKTSSELLDETRKGNTLLEKLLEKFECDSKRTGDFQDTMLQMQESMLRTQESMLQSMRENIDMQRNYTRINHYGKQDWQKPMF